MAYLDLREPHAATLGASRTDPRSGVAPQVQGFRNAEWGIIALARRDGLASLGEPGALSKALTLLFGSRPPLQLADPRLETLRRLAVLAWNYGYAVPASAMKAFTSAGYSVDQLELLLASISSRRPTDRRTRQA